ncbi:MAG: YraN family protein [Firmicutes bacterium]|jgi:putative endonuclease|nr:YraN family protein [Bacillota bacterium]NBI63135.1 YraN family protein [Clostridiales bacterium]
MTNQQLGTLGENTAAEYLTRKGYRILCRNFRCREGEIDIVALKDDTLHFIEVKTRQGVLFGHPLESVTKKKAAHMRAAASRFLAQWPKGWKRPAQIRMDAIAIEIDHVPNI